MTEKDLPTLIAEQRQLLQEKSVILELLKKVRDEMHKLQVIIIAVAVGEIYFLARITRNCNFKGYVLTKLRHNFT
jgi:hypoxanthine-guanine phosphoribosyltransferase